MSDKKKRRGRPSGKRQSITLSPEGKTLTVELAPVIPRRFKRRVELEFPHLAATHVEAASADGVPVLFLPEEWAALDD